MTDSKPSAHAVYYDLATDGSGGLSLAGPPVQVPLGAELKLNHRSAGEIDLELRLLPSPAKDTELIAEVWGDGVRLARQPLGDKVGAKVLPASLFGPPAFSPSGQRIAWVAERPFEAAQAPLLGYPYPYPYPCPYPYPRWASSPSLSTSSRAYPRRRWCASRSPHCATFSAPATRRATWWVAVS